MLSESVGIYEMTLSCTYLIYPSCVPFHSTCALCFQNPWRSEMWLCGWMRSASRRGWISLARLERPLSTQRWQSTHHCVNLLMSWCSCNSGFKNLPNCSFDLVMGAPLKLIGVTNQSSKLTAFYWVSVDMLRSYNICIMYYYTSRASQPIKSPHLRAYKSDIKPSLEKKYEPDALLSSGNQPNLFNHLYLGFYWRKGMQTIYFRKCYVQLNLMMQLLKWSEPCTKNRGTYFYTWKEWEKGHKMADYSISFFIHVKIILSV